MVKAASLFYPDWDPGLAATVLAIAAAALLAGGFATIRRLAV
jgi:hypothetical protein